MNKLIFILSLLLLISCSPIEVREDSRISPEYVKGYHKVIFSHGPRVDNIRLEGISIEADKEYYIEAGEYLLSYEYIPRFTFGMEVSYQKDGRDSNGSDNDHMRPSRETEKIFITGDQAIELAGKTVEINFMGEAGI